MDRLAWGFGMPIAVALVTILVIFLISRLLLVFGDSFIATAVALALAIIVLVAGAFLARGGSSNSATSAHH